MQALALPVTPADGRDYQLYRHANGLHCLLIADPAASRATAVALVDVGSHDEPDAYPGLAHLLEHLLFMGSAGYPQAGSFPERVSRWDGRFNASTAPERTRLHFSVSPEGLDECLAHLLDMLAQPLFSPALVASERQVIDAEFRTRLADPDIHRQAVLGLCFDPRHPGARFSAGNAESLAAEPQRLANELHDFHQRYYRAGAMTLVVHAPASLEHLSSLVGRLAQGLPAGSREPRQRPQPMLYSPAQLIDWSGPGGTSSWTLLWSLADLPAESAAANWLLAWLNSAAPAAALGWLRRQGLVLNWQARIEPGVSDPALLVIELEPLSPALDVDTLLAAWQQWLAALAATDPGSWPCEQRQDWADQAFSRGPQGEPLIWCARLAEQLLRQGPGQLLNSEDWQCPEPQLWRELLMALQDAPHVLRCNAGQVTPEQCRWTATAYARQPLRQTPPLITGIALAPDDWPAWGRRSRAEQDAALATMPPGVRRLASEPAGTWQRTRLAWCWPAEQADFNSLSGLARLWQLQCEVLAEQASLRAVQLDWQVLEGRIELTLSGPREALPELLGELLLSLNPPSETELTVLWRLQQHDHRQRAQALPAYRLLQSLQDGPDQLSTPGLTLADWQRLCAQAQLLWLHPQDWSGESDGVIAGQLRERFPAVAAPFSWGWSLPLMQSGPVPCAHPDRALVVWLPAPTAGALMHIGWRLLEHWLAPAFFDQLRTRQQLGYWVVARYHPLSGWPGILLLVQSPNQPLTLIDEAAIACLEQQHQYLRELPFEQVRQAAARLAASIQTRRQTADGAFDAAWQAALYPLQSSLDEQLLTLRTLSERDWQHLLYSFFIQARRIRLVSAQPG